MNSSRPRATRALYSFVRCVALSGALVGGATLAYAAGATPQSVQATVGSDAFRTSYIQTVYQRLLGRAATPSEVAPLATQLKGGGKAWETVVTTVAGSPAYFQKAGNNNTNFVKKLFQDLVGRAPDATEELPASIDYLKGGSRAELAAVVVDTDEFRERWTQIYYQKLLGRAATDAEATAGGAKLSTGGIAALASSVLSSSEYFQKSGNSQTGWKNAVNKVLLTSTTTTTDDTTIDDGTTGGDGTGGVVDDGTGTGTTGDVPTPDFPTTTTTGDLAINSSRSPMVQALLASPEYSANVVKGYYQKYLKRAPTPVELQQASNAMQGGSSSDQVMMAILTSDEYFNRAGGTTTGYLNRLTQDLLGKGAGKLPSTDDLLDMLRGLGKKK